MAISIEEKAIGRRTSLKEAERLYIIKDCPDESLALSLVLGTAPGAIGGCLLSPSDCDVEEDSPNVFIGKASYKAPSGDGSTQKKDSFSISFDISGSQQHVQYSLGTRGKYKATGQPDRTYHNAIGVDEDGTINGCDILVPTMTFTLNYTVDPTLINDSYISTLRDLIGTVNDEAFKGFDTGELLFTKVTGSQRDAENWDLQFSFAVSKNAEGLTVGDITGIDKQGWDYLWVHYVSKNETDGSGKSFMTKYAANAFVEIVYKHESFGGLGLP